MAYVALYRTWRPQNFDSVIGQPHIVRTLKNAIEKNKTAHAYLFSGPRGTGKTSTAKILAKALNCVHGPTTDPCGTCDNCRKITDGTSMDVLEIDAASNRGIDEIRGLRETVGFLPVDGRYKVYIIDEVHMLTTEAFNALLKTLEEPPPHILFILATTEPHKIPATIHSRCQRYDFRRISAADIQQRLAQVADRTGIRIEPNALKLIADAAEGGMRDALSLLDQCITISDDTVTCADAENLLGMVGRTWVTQLTDHIAARDARKTILTFNQLLASGKEARQTLIELAEHMRDILLSTIADTAVSAAADTAVLKRQAAHFSPDDISRIIKRLYEAAQETKYTADTRITAEVALLDLCARQYGDSDIDRLTARIADLEDKLAQNRLAPTAPAAPKPSAPPNVSTPQMQPHTTSQGANEPKTDRQPQASTPQGISAPQEGTTVRTTTYRAPMPPSRAPETPAPPTSTAPKPAAPSAPQNTAADQDTTAIWQRVLDQLIKDGKRSAYACVKQGRITTITSNAVTVAFLHDFVRERTEKQDYRTMIETILEDTLGRTVRLICTKDTPQPKTKPQPQTNPYADYPRAVQEGIKMFGDNITIIKE